MKHLSAKEYFTQKYGEPQTDNEKLTVGLMSAYAESQIEARNKVMKFLELTSHYDDSSILVVIDNIACVYTFKDITQVQTTSGDEPISVRESVEQIIEALGWGGVVVKIKKHNEPHPQDTAPPNTLPE
jgi:hypothetical protein